MRVFCRQPKYHNNFEAFENNLDRNSKNPAKSGVTGWGGIPENQVTTVTVRLKIVIFMSQLFSFFFNNHVSTGSNIEQVCNLTWPLGAGFGEESDEGNSCLIALQHCNTLLIRGDVDPGRCLIPVLECTVPLASQFIDLSKLVAAAP